MTVVRIANSHSPENVEECTFDAAKVTMKHVLDAGKEKLRMPTTSLLYNALGQPLESDSALQEYLSTTKGESGELSSIVFVSNGHVVDDGDANIQLAMLGGGSVGKSALTLQFIRDTFVEDYNPTIEDSFFKQITVDGSPVSVDILDTAGQDDFKTLRTSWMRDKNALVFVYDITKDRSFDELETEFYSHMCDVYEDMAKPVLILVGNKVDLDNTEALDSDETKKLYRRRVATADAAQRAKEWNAVFFEVSALSGQNVHEFFAAAVRHAISRVIEKEEPVEISNGGCCVIL